MYGSDENASKDSIIVAGMKVMVSLYGGNPSTDTMNELRHNLYVNKIATARSQFDIRYLHSTENAAYYHLMRVHLQCFTWRALDTNILDPMQWGWKEYDGELKPVTTDITAAWQC